jgi:hypothetical protein
MSRRRRNVSFFFFVCSLVVIASSTRILAQESFPSKPISMIIDQGTGGVVTNPITSLFIASASEAGIEWMANNNIGANPLAPNILFWTTEEELQALVQVAEWHRK